MKTREDKNQSTEKRCEYRLLKMDENGRKRIMDEDGELVGHTTEQRNWRGIAIALLVILIVCALIVTAIILVTPGAEEKDKRIKLTLDDILSYTYTPREFEPSWLDGEEAFTYRNEEGSVVEYNCINNNITLLIPNTTFQELEATVFKLSADRKYAFLNKGRIEHVYRHSSLARYSIHNVEDMLYYDFVGYNKSEIFQYIGWTPKGHNVNRLRIQAIDFGIKVFVQNNDIYYKRLEDEDPVQLTFDGVKDVIFNGIPDWVYEEEILGMDNALWWSKEGTYLLYAQFNDTGVRKFGYPVYGHPENKYGEIRYIAYPKPGEHNPTFKLKVINPITKQTVDVKPPQEIVSAAGGYYFTTVSWRDDRYFLVTWLNRYQNMSLFTVCTAVSGDCSINYREEGHGAWVDVFKPALFTADGKNYLMTLPTRVEPSGYFKHVAMVKLPLSTSTGSKKFLTLGQFEVTDIVGINDKNKEVYYIATPGDPRKRHLYSVSMEITSSALQPVRKCLSCDIDEKCQYVKASFSSSGKYYVIGCIGPDVPYFMLKSTESNKTITLEDNSGLRDRLKNKASPIEKYMDIDIGNGQKMHSKVFLPPAFNEEEIITYPLLLTVYGGPGSQEVTEKFEVRWPNYLSSAKNIICAFVDVRGTGARGDNFMHSVYKKLGDLEVHDTITAAKHFDSLSYVESSKMAIWGWSYGGFLTSHVLGQQQSAGSKDLFECGIAVAPVTDWMYYDSVYTERYMSLPKDNSKGYTKGSVLQYAKNFKDSMFMLVHGTGDDNVHFQNSAQLMKALQDEDIHFTQQFYVDKQHSLSGMRPHLYKSMEDFLEECFNGISAKYEERVKALGQKPEEKDEGSER